MANKSLLLKHKQQILSKRKTLDDLNISDDNESDKNLQALPPEKLNVRKPMESASTAVSNFSCSPNSYLEKGMSQIIY